MFEAFFAASNLMVSRPTMRSISAIRSRASFSLRSVVKIVGARSRNSFFQQVTTWDPNVIKLRIVKTCQVSARAFVSQIRHD